MAVMRPTPGFTAHPGPDSDPESPAGTARPRTTMSPIPLQVLREREGGENFPVALRLLPARFRDDLHAVYAVARTIDDLGDRALGDRTAQLEDFRTDLHRVWNGGRPQHPALENLLTTVRTRELSPEPFDQLIQANLQDQRTSRYSTFDDLLEYCRLSADPVGHLVLAVFDQATPTTIQLSDRVCTALQLLEHWQDVGEDVRADRVYLPQDELQAHGVAEKDLTRPHATGAVRALMRFQINRSVDLLEAGAPVVRHLHGPARLAVAGYVAGGRAAARALQRSGGDVLAHRVRPRRHRLETACSLVALLAGAVGRHGTTEVKV